MLSPLLFCLLLNQTPEPPTQPQAAPVQAPAVAPTVAATAPKAVPAPVTKVEDNGLLEYAYFGSELPFSPKLGMDAFWIKDGFSLKNKQVSYGAWESKVLKAGRQEKDLQRAADLAKLIPDALMPQLRVAFQGVTTWQLGGSGDYRFEARVVDANLPNKASKLVFGWLGGKDNLENVTWDMKVTDVKTGEVVLACHHRMVKVNTLGSLDSALRDWSEAFPKKLLEFAR